MSYIIKNRDIVLSIVDTIFTSRIAASYSFFVKTIHYNPRAKAASIDGITSSDTLQWYSSLMDIKLTGDSYISPFIGPTPITADNHILGIQAMYREYFYEKNFDIGRYKFQLKINNCPIGESIYEGVITNFDYDESDDRLGLMNFNIDFTGKPMKELSSSNGIKGFLDDFSLKSLGI